GRPRRAAAARWSLGDGDAGGMPRDARLVARRPRHRATISGPPAMSGTPGTATILRHWREAVPDDRLAHLVKDATRALVRALQMWLAGHHVSFGHWTFLRILWEGDGLTQRELSEQAGVMEPTTFSAHDLVGKPVSIFRDHPLMAVDLFPVRHYIRVPKGPP